VSHHSLHPGIELDGVDKEERFSGQATLAAFLLSYVASEPADVESVSDAL
jgi:hypothetical protein